MWFFFKNGLIKYVTRFYSFYTKYFLFLILQIKTIEIKALNGLAGSKMLVWFLCEFIYYICSS